MSIFNKGYNISDMYDAFGTKVGDKNTPFIADTAFAPKYTRTPESRANLKAGLERSFYGGGPEDPPITPSGVRLPPRPLPQGRVQFTPFDTPKPQYTYNKGDASQMGDSLFQGVGQIFKDRNKPGYFANRKVPSFLKPVTNALSTAFPYAVPAADAGLKMLQSGLMGGLGVASKATGFGGDLTADALYKTGILDLDAAQKFGERLSVAPFAVGEAYAGQLAGINALAAKTLKSSYKTGDFVKGKKPLTLKEFREKYPDYRSSTTLKTPEGSVFQTVDYPNLLSKSELKKVTAAQRMVDSLRINPLLPPSEINARIKTRFKNVTVDYETMKAGIAKPIPTGKVDELNFLKSELNLIPSKSSAPYVDLRTHELRDLDLSKRADEIEKNIRNRNRVGLVQTNKQAEELNEIKVTRELIAEQMARINAKFDLEDDGNKALNKILGIEEPSYFSEFSGEGAKASTLLSTKQIDTINKAYPDTIHARDHKARLEKINILEDELLKPGLTEARTEQILGELDIIKETEKIIGEIYGESGMGAADRFTTPLSRVDVDMEKGLGSVSGYAKGAKTSLNERAYAGTVEALNNRLRNGEITRKQYNAALQREFQELNNTGVHEVGHSVAGDTRAFGAGGDQIMDLVKSAYGTYGPYTELMKKQVKKYLGSPTTITGARKAQDPIEELLIENLTKEFNKAVANLEKVPNPKIYRRSQHLGYWNQTGEKKARFFGERAEDVAKKDMEVKQNTIQNLEEEIKRLRLSADQQARTGTIKYDESGFTTAQMIEGTKKEIKRIKETDLEEEYFNFMRASKFNSNTKGKMTRKDAKPMIEDALELHRRDPSRDLNKTINDILYGNPLPYDTGGPLDPFAYVSP
jgi:hypothetical protein